MRTRRTQGVRSEAIMPESNRNAKCRMQNAKLGNTSSVVYDATFPKGEGLSRFYLLLITFYLLPLPTGRSCAQGCKNRVQMGFVNFF